MWFTICALGFIGSLWLWGYTHRNRYQKLRTTVDAPIKEQLVRLPLNKIKHTKLRQEIKIFNHLALIMPTCHGVPVMYTEQLRRLLAKPTYQPGQEPYEKLFYGYACAVLLSKNPSELVARQLNKNLLFLFAPKHKIVKRIHAKLGPAKPEWFPVPIYKIFNQGYVDPREPGFRVDGALSLMVCDSYLKYYRDDLVVRRYFDYYELSAVGWQKMTLTVAKDKSDYDCRVSRGVVTCKNLVTGETQTWAVRGEQVRIGTSLCAEVDALEIYVSWQGEAVISVNQGTKQLLTRAEIQANQRVQAIVEKAYHAKYVHGEKLRARYLSAEKCVPSLRLLTRVVIVEQPDDFFKVWDDLPTYQRSAKMFGGFNLVFIYSGANRLTTDLVAGFISAEEQQACQAVQLFLYFIDRTVTEPDALYFLTKMSKANFYAPVNNLPVTAVPKAFPYVKSVTVANPNAEPITKYFTLPLVLRSPAVLTTNGQTVLAENLFSGRVTEYRLPVPFHLRGEFLTTHLNIPCRVRLMGFEEKQLKIIRVDDVTRTKRRSKAWLDSLSQIVLTTTDKKLNAIFAKPISEQEDSALLNMVKLAYKNVDKKILIAFLEDRHALPSDVWQYLLSKVVGIRLANGKIHLVPCVNLLGEFVLTFNCQGQKFTFNTRKGLPEGRRCVTIPHGQKIERY